MLTMHVGLLVLYEHYEASVTGSCYRLVWMCGCPLCKQWLWLDKQMCVFPHTTEVAVDLGMML